MKTIRSYSRYFPLLIPSLFFILYSLLSLIKHNHFLSGYDLSIVDQIMWKYSQFSNPITTVHAYPFTSIFTDHIELIYLLLSPIYWVFDDVRALILLQSFFLCMSGIPVYLLARVKGLGKIPSLAILVSYLSFFGIQNAVWNDVHSLAFAASFLPWLIYFLSIMNTKWTLITFFLAIICKEDIGFLTFFICFVFFVIQKRKLPIVLMCVSLLYILLIFFVFYPHFTTDGYRFQEGSSILSNLNPTLMYDTEAKRQSIFYSTGWFGFLPFFSPLYFIPALADFSHYFVLGRNVESAQEIFLHYRVALAPLIVWPTIVTIVRFKRIHLYVFSSYLLICALVFQYLLHSPLSYLTKSWFWTEPSGVKHINSLLPSLPDDASVVSQVNIIPHIAHRDLIFTLWPRVKSFPKNSPCGKDSCDWFHWVGAPEYLLVDTSPEWDARHMLTNRENFVAGITNLERANVIHKEKTIGSATLYRVVKKP